MQPGNTQQHDPRQPICHHDGGAAAPCAIARAAWQSEKILKDAPWATDVPSQKATIRAQHSALKAERPSWPATHQPGKEPAMMSQVQSCRLKKMQDQPALAGEEAVAGMKEPSVKQTKPSGSD